MLKQLLALEKAEDSMAEEPTTLGRDLAEQIHDQQPLHRLMHRSINGLAAALKSAVDSCIYISVGHIGTPCPDSAPK
jgi:hypothetical protein